MNVSICDANPWWALQHGLDISTSADKASPATGHHRREQLEQPRPLLSPPACVTRRGAARGGWAATAARVLPSTTWPSSPSTTVASSCSSDRSRAQRHQHPRALCAWRPWPRSGLRGPVAISAALRLLQAELLAAKATRGSRAMDVVAVKIGAPEVDWFRAFVLDLGRRQPCVTARLDDVACSRWGEAA